MANPISPMLRLFRDGAPSYQPAVKGLECETGDPGVSRDNIQRLIDSGLVLADFLVRPTGVLVLFAGFEMYYAPGLRVGTNGLATEALAHFAAQAGFGPEDELRHVYGILPADYSGQLVNLNTRPLKYPVPPPNESGDGHPTSGFGPTAATATPSSTPFAQDRWKDRSKDR